MSIIRVVFLSNWQLHNPYQKLLAEQLISQGCQVEIYYCDLIFLPFFMKFWQPTILHIHTLHPFLVSKHKFYQPLKTFVFLIQILILKILQIKIVWTVHEWNDKMAGGKYSLNQTHIFIIDKFLDALITHSNFTKLELAKSFENLVNKNKLFVVSHANYIDYYPNQINQQEARKNLGIPAKTFVFLLFGNIYPYKGFIQAIEAFQALPPDNIYLLIAGKPVDQNIAILIENKIKNSENISFSPKFIANDQVQLYFNASDCAIMPYQVFTTSGIALLAMSFGRVCIAPKIGHFSEILDQYGAFLYDPNANDGLLQSMKFAIDNQYHILDMGKHNFTIAQQWNWHLMAQQTLKIYTENL
ncbi:glycosyltransferase family 4 protein [Anabaena sp. UHCC 0451]|uniref:glycosyltransferase family 4 protein n=1 Tax=Anabaena sp. UHCC 0451 TaxID=2055235 RepID=UPI002B21E024|nr:glycosyltransferase family 4 protein [Anabaena sp. UHCC 0451]MEA5577333.1 glycosyltransferase family 4 protein [Anabaena sp. UHCC 0451]